MVRHGNVDVPQTLSDGLVVQFRVVHALLMREVLTRFGRHNIGFLWMFLEPMIFTLFVAGLWAFTGFGHLSNLPIFAFAITGYTSVLLWRNVPARLMKAVEPNASLMYHRYVRLLDVYLARAILEVGGVLVSFFALSLGFWLAGYLRLPEDPLTVVYALVLLAWFGLALGLLMGALSERSELVEKIWHPVSYIMFPLSGAAFLVDALPSSVQSVVLFFPMIHGVELLRAGFFGSMFVPHYEISYLICVNLVLTMAGLSQTRMVSDRIQPG